MWFLKFWLISSASCLCIDILLAILNYIILTCNGNTSNEKSDKSDVAICVIKVIQKYSRLHNPIF